MGSRCNHLTRKQEHEVVAFLKDILEEVEGEEGLVSYKDDWNDNKVADKFLCTDNNVRSLRAEFYGRLVRPRGKKEVGYDELLRKYEEVLERVKFIEDQLGIKFERKVS